MMSAREIAMTTSTGNSRQKLRFRRGRLRPGFARCEPTVALG